MEQEFIAFISEKTGIKNLELIEKDVLIHTILTKLCSNERFASNYLLKGGTCLVKCYFGYYRFSVDLDFTFPYIEDIKELSKKERRKLITREVKGIARLLEDVSKDLGLIFKPFTNRKHNSEFVNFIGTEKRKTVIFNLKTKKEDVIKVEITFFEKLLFEPKKVSARTLLSEISLSSQERFLYKKELEKYSPICVLAYSPEEILVEKIRAVFTRGHLKARDFYDVYILWKNGYNYRNFKNKAIEKIKSTPGIKIKNDIIENISKSENTLKAELELFVMKIDEKFWDFLKDFREFLKDLYKLCK